MAHHSDVLYVVPPYLLNTSYGLNLKQQLMSKDEELANSNVISHNSVKYVNPHERHIIPENQITGDKNIDKILKQKLIYKFSILGILGKDPMDSKHISDARLYELWQIFRDRILADKERNAGSSSKDESKYYSSKLSEKVGEVFLNEDLFHIPDNYVDELDKYLKDLLVSTKRTESRSYNIPRRLIKFDDGSFFDYGLPVSWAPLMTVESFAQLQGSYNFEISNSKGSPSIKIAPPASSESPDLAYKWYNFITDKPVRPLVGVFYYELAIKQESLLNHDSSPLINMSDSSESSENSLHFSMGFINRKVNLDPPGPSSGTAKVGGVPVDLEAIKSDIYYYRDNDAYVELSDEIQHYLSLKAGIMKGSHVINFEELSFQNSIREGESRQRSAAMNLNRRLSQLGRPQPDELSNGSIDLEIPFNTNISQTKNRKSYRSDIVGCGINFIDKSVFITLNGILVRSIPYDSIKSRLSTKDSLFEHEEDNSVYPVIGFELIGTKKMKTSAPSSKSEVIANFGNKDFKFNINSYVKEYKAQKQNQLYLTELDKVQKLKPPTTMPFKDGFPSTIQELLSYMNDDPKIINEFISGYLEHEGYLGTLKAFNKDLKTLENEINGLNQIEDDEGPKHPSHSYDRQLIKPYLHHNQFDQLSKFLKTNYSNVMNKNVLRELLFEVDYVKLLYLLRKYLDIKLNSSNFEFDFEYKTSDSEAEAYGKAISWSKYLLSEYSRDKGRSKKVHEICKALLIDDSKSVKNYPGVMYILENYQKKVNKLSDQINKNILTSLGLNESSSLETIINETNKNINKLSLELEDENFMLINYEQDYIDLA